jgi:protein TonB
MQRHALLATIAALHVGAGWALLQVREVRDAVAEAAPMFVSLLAPTPPKAQPTPPKAEPRPAPPPRPVRARPPERIVAAPAAPTPAPRPFVVPAPVPEPELVARAAPEQPAPAPAAAPPQAVVVVPKPAPTPPKTLPASAVQYLDPPSPSYPAQSKRLGETGRVTVRVFIDEAGGARDVRVDRSSGHLRLDEAALVAVQRARFRPYLENGLPVAGWAFIPIDFALER